MPSTIHYLVCPITGLSSTIQDDYKHNDLWPATHHTVANAARLYKMIETKSNSLPTSYIAAGILLQLTESELIANPKQEPQYLRGKVNEELQKIPTNCLIELYWQCRNTRAHLNSQPLTVNLTTAATQNAQGIYKTLKAIACQDVTKADMETYIKTRNTLKQKKERLSVAKMDIKSVSNRVAKLLPKLHNAIPDSGATLALTSVRKAASFLIWDDNVGAPKWLTVTPAIRARVTEIIDTMMSIGKEEYMLSQDSVEHKSLKLIRRYLTGELKDAGLGCDWGKGI